jgi:Lon protease-like protein
MNLPPIPFTQEIPLFPLPNCVLFPGTVQPLHIFEPRYRAMVQAALREAGCGMDAGGCGGVLAMALLRPGWEKDYYGHPPIYDCLCAGRIIAHERLPDGKFNLLLQGIARARVISERPCIGEWGAYRLARLAEIPEIPVTPEQQSVQREMLRRLFETSALKDLTITPALAALFEDSVPATRLIDALSFSLVQDMEAKQRLLEEADVDARGQLLLRELMALARRLEAMTVKQTKGCRCWPPELGEN